MIKVQFYQNTLVSKTPKGTGVRWRLDDILSHRRALTTGFSSIVAVIQGMAPITGRARQGSVLLAMLEDWDLLLSPRERSGNAKNTPKGRGGGERECQRHICEFHKYTTDSCTPMCYIQIWIKMKWPFTHPSTLTSFNISHTITYKLKQHSMHTHSKLI